MNKETIEQAAKAKPNYTWRNPVLTAELTIHTEKYSHQTRTTMQQEIISDKAQDYVSRLYSENEYPTTLSDVGLDVETAFADGAQWRINSVWHDVSEKPKENELVLTEDDYDGEPDYCICQATFPKWEDDLILFRTKRWAYIKDLLPDGKEE